MVEAPIRDEGGAPVPPRIGVQVQPQHADFEGMRQAWRAADELGVDAIFTWDHFYPLYGEPDGKHFESLTTMASMAEVTERAQVGALVICNSYRNPELLADAHRTVDHISGGRAILGIGSGWFERDYDEYGYEFGTVGSRLRDLGAALPRIRARLGKLNPPPIGQIPILIGGSGEKVTLRLVAEHADMWHGFGDVDTFRHKADVLARHCADVGRDPSAIERTWGVRDALVEQAEDLYAAGVQMLVLGIGGDGTGYDLGGLRELVAWRDGLES
jgi:probable F420-dependent oxidoreductase